eukprot:gene565-613_t
MSRIDVREMNEQEIENDIVGISESAHGLVFEHIDQSEAEFLYEEIFVRRSYVHDPVSMPPDISGTVIVDIGANIGLFSLWCLREIPKCNVVAFEPIPRITRVLTRNLKAHHYSGRAKVIAAGVADVAGEATFAYYGDAPGESTRNWKENDWQQEKLSQEPRKQEWVKVQVVTLKEAVPGPITWLKVDAEGDELLVLQGAGNLTRIRQISCEVRDVDGRLKAVVDLLEKNQFEVVAKQQVGGDVEGYRMTVPRSLQLYYVYAKNKSAVPEDSDEIELHDDIEPCDECAAEEDDSLVRVRREAKARQTMAYSGVGQSAIPKAQQMAPKASPPYQLDDGTTTTVTTTTMTREQSLNMTHGDCGRCGKCPTKMCKADFSDENLLRPLSVTRVKQNAKLPVDLLKEVVEAGGVAVTVNHFVLCPGEYFARLLHWCIDILPKELPAGVELTVSIPAFKIWWYTAIDPITVNNITISSLHEIPPCYAQYEVAGKKNYVGDLVVPLLVLDLETDSALPRSWVRSIGDGRCRSGPAWCPGVGHFERLFSFRSLWVLNNADHRYIANAQNVYNRATNNRECIYKVTELAKQYVGLVSDRRKFIGDRLIDHRSCQLELRQPYVTVKWQRLDISMCVPAIPKCASVDDIVGIAVPVLIGMRYGGAMFQMIDENWREGEFEIDIFTHGWRLDSSSHSYAHVRVHDSVLDAVNLFWQPVLTHKKRYAETRPPVTAAVCITGDLNSLFMPHKMVVPLVSALQSLESELTLFFGLRTPRLVEGRNASHGEVLAKLQNLFSHVGEVQLLPDLPMSKIHSCAHNLPSCLPQYFRMKDCFSQVKRYEETISFRQFDWVLRARPDLHFLTEIGPLSSYDAQKIHVNWFADSAPADVFAMTPRHLTHVLFNIYDDGCIAKNELQFCDESDDPNIATCECFWKRRFQRYNVSVGKFGGQFQLARAGCYVPHPPESIDISDCKNVTCIDQLPSADDWKAIVGPAKVSTISAFLCMDALCYARCKSNARIQQPLFCSYKQYKKMGPPEGAWPDCGIT